MVAAVPPGRMLHHSKRSTTQRRGSTTDWAPRLRAFHGRSAIRSMGRRHQRTVSPAPPAPRASATVRARKIRTSGLVSVARTAR